MPLPAFCRETVLVERAPLVESRGTVEPAAPERHEVAGCLFDPGGSSSERGEPRVSGTATTATLYAPAGADLRAGDAVVCRAGRFLVEGRPLLRESPTEALSHIECALSEWRG